MNIKKPCVLIYNPISGHGHLDAWNAMFIYALLREGWRVLALTPDVSALMSRLAQKGAADSPNLHVLDWNAKAAGFNVQVVRTWLWHLWRRWDAFGDRYYYRRPGSETTPNMPLLAFWRVKLFQLVVPPMFRASHFVYVRYRRRRDNRYLPPKDARLADAGRIDPEANYLEPAQFAIRTEAALKKSKWKPLLAFNMYMDMYRTCTESWNRFRAETRLPWAGIRFVPREAPTEGYYRVSSFRGMCFLDADICRAYREKMPEKCFEYLPDVTDITLPDRPSPVAEEIKRRAGGRKIVFLGGSIGGQKNLACWYDLIRIADERSWFFVQIGELHKGTFTSADLAALEGVLSSPPENLLIRTSYLKDEQAFNDIIATSDVLFAVYRDFRISSNMLSKAAGFRKPILVSDRYQMGALVTRYGIGLAVPEDDTAQMLEGLFTLVRTPISDEKFLRFSADFSLERLVIRLSNFVQRCSAARKDCSLGEQSIADAKNSSGDVYCSSRSK